MPNYRIYSLDFSGRIVVGVDVVCADDGGAVDFAAARFGRPNQFEIWEGTRLVSELPTRRRRLRPTEISEAAASTSQRSRG